MARIHEETVRLVQQLAHKARIIPLEGNKISFLQTPTDYFNQILEQMSSSSHRLLIASLYCGTTGGPETEFLDALSAAVSDPKRPNLEVTVLLDALRGARPTKTPAGEASSSTIALSSMLRPNMQVSLFHTPALTGILKRVLPPRVNEVIGVSHMKAIISDNDVLMTGANLSSDYFTMRQDRYMLCTDSVQLATWLTELVKGVADFSYRLQPQAMLAPCPAGVDPISQPTAFQCALRTRLTQLSAPDRASSSDAQADTPAQQQSDEVAQQAAGLQHFQASRLANLISKPQEKRGWLQKQQSPAHTKPGNETAAAAAAAADSNAEGDTRSTLDCNSPGDDDAVSSVARDVFTMAEQALGNQSRAAVAATESESSDAPRPDRHQWQLSGSMQGSSSSEDKDDPDAGELDTWVLPAVQLGSVGVRQEEAMTALFLRSAQPGGTLTISSPYLNLARQYKNALAAAPQVNIDLLTASPAANGFFGAAGAAGFIPTAYSLLQRTTWRFLNQAWNAAGPSPGIRRRLLEYGREGWQFHAKGIWYTPPGESLPIATAVGSSNFGYRSLERDLECQLFVVTANLRLRQALAQEVAALQEHARDVSQQQLQPLQPEISYRARLAASLMRSFL